MDFTIGADVEFMLEKNGKLVSAVPVLGHKRRKLPFGDIFFDNVLAEFTVEPANNREAFIDKVWKNLEASKEIFEKDGIGIRIVSSAHYPDEELQTNEARLFGCSPDFCAYELKVNEVSCEADETTLRTAGGHVHFSHPIFEDPFKIVEMIKLMDLRLGVLSVLKDNGPEAIERRSLYGAAGAHRPKEYPGGEYRPLSNWWIRDRESIGLVYDITKQCLQEVVDGKTIDSLGFDSDEIRDIINSGDENRAKEIIKEI